MPRLSRHFLRQFPSQFLAKLLPRSFPAFQQSLILLLLTLGVLLSWQLATPAQSTVQLEARLTRLESENTTLRSRVSRLENSIARLSNIDTGNLPQAPVIDSPSSVGSGLADDPVFKRLATLVIELRERIIAVEDRLAGRTAPQ